VGAPNRLAEATRRLLRASKSIKTRIRNELTAKMHVDNKARAQQTTPQGTYAAGDAYTFYRDLRRIIQGAGREVFIVDGYLNRELFDLYAGDIPATVELRVLTQSPDLELIAVAKKYLGSHPRFELRSSRAFHDRVVFVDDDCWLIGQSSKDAGTKKPTYLVKHDSERDQRSIYEAIWSAATLVAAGLRNAKNELEPSDKVTKK
jgi:hypothetical protein